MTDDYELDPECGCFGSSSQTPNMHIFIGESFAIDDSSIGYSTIGTALKVENRCPVIKN
ncbi:11000_t:CDS:2 [Funneliformis mosseae]|uniref:11000_t:CDS:1 n=1 Tax=Funneliformis mosseae TaxID=27381 RepID=A0A9N9FQL1_FUNMO|nr:11000_t:CDS:2 [Funneliformis mosseae]